MALTDLEIQAAIYSVVGLPEVFQEATFIISPTRMEVCDALGFLQPPLPITVSWTASKPGLPDISKQKEFRAGFASIEVPGGYAGGTVTIQSQRPLVAYTLNEAEAFIFGGRRSEILRRVVAPKDSKHRVTLVARDGVRLELLPTTPQALGSDPSTAPVWKAFLAKASETR